MGIAHRSHLTAGISLLGVGAIALAPVQPAPDHVALAQQGVVNTLAVELAAVVSPTIDPITPWVNAFTTAGANVMTLNQQMLDPDGYFPVADAILSNWGIYAAELLSPAGPNIGGIFNQIIGNIGAALAAPGDQNLVDTETKYPDGSPLEISANTNNTEEVGDFGSKFVTTYGIGFGSIAVPALIPLVNLANQLSTPLLGALLGFAGPGLSALAQTMDSVKIISTALMALDFITAVNESINLPANLTNAYLNGAKNLDLTALVGALGIALPDGAKVGLATGGLLSPGWALGSAPGTPDPGPAPFSGWGGTAWDAVSADIPDLAGFEGLPVGAIATGYGLKNAIAQAITLPGGPKSAQAAAPAAAQVAPAVADESAAVQAAVVSEAAKVEVPAEIVADIEPAAQAPAPKAVSTRGGQEKTAAAGDNAGGNTRAAHAGTRGKRNAD